MSKKQAILEVATKLFSKNGFKDTSIADLAKAIGTAQGTIFYHFNSKEQLFLAVLKSVKERIIHEFKGHLRERKYKIGLDMVEDAVSFYLYLAGTMEDQFLLLHRHDAYELAQGNTICRQNLEDIYNSILDIFEKAVLLGQKDGSIEDMPYKLYDAGALYNELIASCRRILQNKPS